MNKSVWLILVMGLMTALLLSTAMMISLGQFQEVPAADWVKVAEATAGEFKLENVAVRVSLSSTPSQMKISYASPFDSKFDLSAQNAEMEKVANFAIRAYKGRDVHLIEQIAVTRSETHGSGCFRQTYVSSLTVPNTRKRDNPGRSSDGPPPFPPRDR